MPIGEKLAQIIISIHAPRKGERRKGDKPRGRKKYFNPRSPQGGATTRPQGAGNEYPHFNPRSPQGGATGSPGGACLLFPYFNPRSPQGGATFHIGFITSHASLFQSTLPTRGSDFGKLKIIRCLKISIHAPHEGERHVSRGIAGY